MKSNGYPNNNHNEKHKYVPPKVKNADKIQDMFKVQNRHVPRKSIKDDDASNNLTEFQQLTDDTYTLNRKQLSCFGLTSKFKGYVFDNKIIKRASKQAFTIDINKVESKTQLHNEIEKVEKYNNKLDALFKRNFISCKNISNILPFLSVFIGDTSLDSLTTTECSYIKWEKEELNISKSNIKPTEEFIKAVKNALRSKDKEAQLRRVSKEYGNFYTLRLVFGGAMIKEASGEEILDIDNNQNSEVRVIGGIKEHNNGFSLKPWIKSLNDCNTWDIIEYDEIYSIFDLLNDSLQKEILDVLGYRILKEKDDRDNFSLRIDYVNVHMPLIIVHLKKSLRKKHKNNPVKVGWIIVGQPINFDFDQTNYPVLLRSGELPIFKINNQYKIEFSKNRDIIESCTLNSCVLGLPEVNTKCLMNLSVYDINDINQLMNDENVSQKTALFCWQF
ncbi:28619_t:CDS:2 [Dentiscutata erythropus]|uniref:28619_t:CDS:1 n=1 Tax=Dentiscutata erythropus TaxID=1348616 RepID=A0A9N9BZH8_9GLOM|nr:28619_t:CDS:2 [Dentiscutata erythropus]